MKVTLFNKLTDTKTHKHIDVITVLEGIRKGNKLKPVIDRIRAAETKEEKDELKKTLPLVTFGGVFSERKASALKQYSRLICLDFDGLGEGLEEMKQHLMSNAHVMAVWKSPGGDGLKCLVKVASDNHLGHALALLKEYPEADVNAVKDINRACFLSYDPELHYNPKADVYTKFVENVKTNEEKFDLLKKWLSNKGESFVQGNRNSFLAKLFGAMNRFGIPQEYAWEVVERDYLKSSEFSAREAKSVLNSIYTNYSDQFNTASFDDTFSESQVNEILSTEVKANDIITVKDVQADLLDAYDNEIKGGDTTFFPEFDKCFRFMRGELTVVSGVPSSGKSTFLTQLLVTQSAMTGKKWGILSMEQYPPTYFYREIIRMIIGKPVEQNNPNRMTKQEYTRAMEWANEKFVFIFPESDEPSPEWTMARFLEAIVKFGVDGCVIDPHNSQSHDYKSTGREDLYLGKMLSKYKRFALQNDMYFFDVAHPRSVGKHDDKHKMYPGCFKEPDASEISGGPIWWQKVDNIIIGHRPSLPVDPYNRTFTARTQKVKKQPLNGRPGVVEFNYDFQCGRYYDYSGYNPLTKFKL
jgi:hypothetical protein